MLVVDEKSRVSVGDKVKFKLLVDQENEIEGLVTYDFDRNLIITTGQSNYPFDSRYIASWVLDEPGPFHNAFNVEQFGYSGLDPRNVGYSIKTTSNDEFEYHYGESACDVFERWKIQLNNLSKKVNG